jgi:hypothetical protein
MMDSMMFCVGGYDNDPREIHMIPDVRRFYRQFNQACPYWFYFCNLDHDTLKAMTFCCLDQLVIAKVDGQSQVAVEPDKNEMIGFMSRNFGGMNQVCERANMFESLVRQRTSRLLEYYGGTEPADLGVSALHVV